MSACLPVPRCCPAAGSRSGAQHWHPVAADSRCDRGGEAVQVQAEALLCHDRPRVPGCPRQVPATLAPVANARVPFLWLCGPPGVGKSSVGYAIFQLVYRSGVKVAYVDLDQVGLCYPSPADDPHNHRVKAQNLGVVWPTYQAAGARCLIAVGAVPSREIVMTYAGKVPDADLTLCRLRAKPECLTERFFRRGAWPGSGNSGTSGVKVQGAARRNSSGGHPRRSRPGRRRLR